MSVGLERPDPDRPLFKGKWLQYVEQDMLLHTARAGGQPVLVPDLQDEARTVETLSDCHGLLLTGGTDIAPQSYGEQPKRPEWAGDRQRDLYELALLHAALDLEMPVLGICRGHQLVNVGCGGTLYQDIETECSDPRLHRDPELYDKLEHEISITQNSLLAGVLGRDSMVVNSVHHQAIRELGTGLAAVALSPDRIIEAVEGPDGFLLGIQWHPEWWHRESPAGAEEPIFAAFVAACDRYLQQRNANQSRVT